MATTTTIGTQFSASTTRPTTRPLADRLEEVVESWARTQYELVTLAAEFADSPEWLLTGSPTAAHWLAIIADVEPCTTREWIRIGRKLADLPAIADAFKTRAISYNVPHFGRLCGAGSSGSGRDYRVGEPGVN